jgi:hypothetical protein
LKKLTSSPANSRKILWIIIDSLFLESPNDLSTVQIANICKLHPGLVGAILTRSPWATRRRRVRINRNKCETRWAASDAALIDYARRHAALTIRKAALLALKGVIATPDSRGRVTLRCGSVTTIVHTD